MNSKAHVIVVIGILALIGCGRENRVRVLKLAHGLDSSHPVHKAMEYMAERALEKSGGKLRIDVYPSSQLGTERECLELLQIGSLGMTKVSTSVMEGFVPSYKVFSLPYLFRDDAHRFQVLEGEIGMRLLQAPEKFFLRGLCYYDAGSRSFYTKARPIMRPADLAGLKIRTQESATPMKMVLALGGSPTPIAWGELYTALQQGVVDGAENNPPSFHLSRHYEVCKYYALDEHSSVPDVLVISTVVWNALSPQEQQWLQEAVDESAEYQKKIWQEATAHALAEVQKAGVEIFYPDKTLFTEQVAGLYEEYRSQPEIYNLIQEIKAVR
ncbi:MAG: TRAP transporter substrate-binding protein [candidate division KSB1 bacterium]|nr:TRAP transporter substrate-binding protein [candidate division KSB1 bacterium]MDZ7273541.1 TRAP transporter substrate-binding protein [candidate division KSB1 bacterium]MDZ7286868.1 TRAP transporter substrate-binding protein [candidate division KSB1 bacterium]MDZ7299779.1 TRAP transporter substrate-binding protein [candidate division KSB1 bacterium]MDZ7307662.1 TRAP transporter substrate-binding protein [candidate division KSB1 bacterium]